MFANHFTLAAGQFSRGGLLLNSPSVILYKRWEMLVLHNFDIQGASSLSFANNNNRLF